MTISELATSKQTALRTLRAGGVILVYDDEYALHLGVLSRNERTRGDAERGRAGRWSALDQW